MWLDDIASDAISPENASPLHRQLGDTLRAAITDRSLPPGSHLPTEAALQQKFGISRSVIRQALATLTAEGLIQRGRGRGSVVAPPIEHHRLVQRMPGLSSQIAGDGSFVATEVLTLGPASDARAEAELGTSELIRLRRRRSARSEAIAIIETWLPARLAPGLSAEELTDASLHAVLRERYGVPVTTGRRQVRALAATEQLAGELRIDVGTPLLLLEGVSLDDRGAAVEVFSTWHRADRVVFDIDVTGDGGTAFPTPSVLPAEPTGRGRSKGRGSPLARRVRELSRELDAVSRELERGSH